MSFHAKNTLLHNHPMRSLTDDSLWEPIPPLDSSINPRNVTCDSVTHNTGNTPPITKR
ncbi:hypothetical protein M422DRAFT_36261 [Sphaerobolus stellatus SS14]|uniref:Uncharacterized protein n=1 Tax=Sphaerobolus stellatus (strain SS14) TaxID=990650 RepID=A0A0C9TMW8_SPHS4|nr:hypothetical protein M422DRAFT_36261 [Sphaerobolus stellatus SS14]